MTGEAPALVYSTGMMWEHNSFCSSLPIPETSSACQIQEFPLSWLQLSFQLCFFHFFNCVSKATGFRGLKSFEKKNTFHLILCLQECMPRFTFELLPTLPNSIVPFVSISYIWIFFPFPLAGLVSRMEETSTQALRTAPALIWHLFLKCLKRCLTEFFPFKLASYMSVEISGSFSHQPQVDVKSECFPQADVLQWRQGGTKESAQESLSQDGIQPSPPTLSPWHWFLKQFVLNYKMAIVNDVLSLFLLKKQVTYCLVSSHGLCFSGCVWRSQESLAKKRKICLTRLNACPVTQALWLMPTATLLKSQPARDMKEKGHIKAALLQ